MTEEMPVKTPLTTADLERAHATMMRLFASPAGLRKAEIAKAAHHCDQMCPECPWRVKPNGNAPWPREEHAKLEHHAEHMGGFACHMADGNDRSFSLTTRTDNPCRGWQKAGGNIDALRRRFSPESYPRFVSPEISIRERAEKIEREMTTALAMQEMTIGEFIPPKSFRCPVCRRVSYNKNDVLNNYCGACHRFF